MVNVGRERQMVMPLSGLFKSGGDGLSHVHRDGDPGESYRGTGLADTWDTNLEVVGRKGEADKVEIEVWELLIYTWDFSTAQCQEPFSDSDSYSVFLSSVSNPWGFSLHSSCASRENPTFFHSYTVLSFLPHTFHSHSVAYWGVDPVSSHPHLLPLGSGFKIFSLIFTGKQTQQTEVQSLLALTVEFPDLQFLTSSEKASGVSMSPQLCPSFPWPLVNNILSLPVPCQGWKLIFIAFRWTQGCRCQQVETLQTTFPV